MKTMLLTVLIFAAIENGIPPQRGVGNAAPVDADAEFPFDPYADASLDWAAILVVGLGLTLVVSLTGLAVWGIVVQAKAVKTARAVSSEVPAQMEILRESAERQAESLDLQRRAIEQSRQAIELQREGLALLKKIHEALESRSPN